MVVCVCVCDPDNWGAKNGKKKRRKKKKAIGPKRFIKLNIFPDQKKKTPEGKGKKKTNTKIKKKNDKKKKNSFYSFFF